MFQDILDGNNTCMIAYLRITIRLLRVFCHSLSQHGTSSSKHMDSDDPS